MSFKRLDLEDIVISADGVTAPAWTGNVVTLSSFFTSSNQSNGTSGKYYLNLYQTGSELSNASIQCSVTYGHVAGSGSVDLNSQVTGYSPSKIIYGQYRTLVNGTEEENIAFGEIVPKSIYAISIERARFKEKLFPGSLYLKLTNSGETLELTDNSNYVSTETFSDTGRIYQIISASSSGVKTPNTLDPAGLGYTPSSGSYGLFLPDAGLILLNGDALDLSSANGGISLGTGVNPNSGSNNPSKLFDAINLGGSFTLRSEETVSSNYVFIRARNSEFNYSTNPSNITGSGELRHSVMIDTPQAYITAVGLYNDNNDLLAVAKLSRPLLKDFTKEALVRIKLDY
jgi:hypothetical protein